MKVLERDDEARIYRAPVFGPRAYAHPTGGGEYLLTNLPDDGAIAVKGGADELDAVLAWLLERDPGHEVLAKIDGGYWHAPLALEIRAVGGTPQTGTEFGATIADVPCTLYRLRTFRALLRAVREARSTLTTTEGTT